MSEKFWSQETKRLWYGKPLESYSKEELIEIVCAMDRLVKVEKEWHDKERRIMKLITR